MNILVVDDNLELIELMANILQTTPHRVHTATNGKQALDILDENSVDIMIVDWMMPEMSGIELVKTIREQFKETFIYIIMLTARSTPDDKYKGLESGVDEYLAKPVYPREILARLAIAERIVQHERTLKRNLEHMEGLATHDQLTGIYNRSHFLAQVQPLYARMQQNPQPMTILMIDLDGFKQVNDLYGHLVGDEVLRTIAGRLKDNLRQTDYLGRYGGEEFIAALPQCELQQAIGIAERVREAIQQDWIVVDEHEVRVTASIGVAVSNGEIDLMKLIERADKALYEAKHAGRNRTRYYLK